MYCGQVVYSGQPWFYAKYEVVDPAIVDMKHNDGGGYSVIRVPGILYDITGSRSWDEDLMPGRLYCESFGNGGS